MKKVYILNKIDYHVYFVGICLPEHENDSALCGADAYAVRHGFDMWNFEILNESQVENLKKSLKVVA